MSFDVVLKAKLGNSDLTKSSKMAEKLGGKLETVDKATADKNDIGNKDQCCIPNPATMI